MVILAVENGIENLLELEKCIKKQLPDAELHGFVNGRNAIAWAKQNAVDLVFAQFDDMEEAVDGCEGAEVAEYLFNSGKCCNLILRGITLWDSLDAWNLGASFFYIGPVSTKKIKMGLQRLRFPIPFERKTAGEKGLVTNHLTEADKEFPKADDDQFLTEEEALS